MANLKEKMRSIGCDVFIEILYPELKRNIKVDVEYLGLRYEKYSKYTLNSQKSRLSKSKSIFVNGEVCDALRFVVDSHKVSDIVKFKAKGYLKQEILNHTQCEHH